MRPVFFAHIVAHPVYGSRAGSSIARVALELLTPRATTPSARAHASRLGLTFPTRW